MEDQKPVTSEEFICEDCGTTTPVSNDSCTSCGGRLVPVDAMREPTDHELSAEDEELSDDLSTAVDESGSESLESLAEKELNEDQRSYNEDSYDDE